MKNNYSYFTKAGTIIAIALNLNFSISAQMWTQKANLPTSRNEAISFSMNDKVYIGGGSHGLSTTYYTDFWEYDPATDTWVQKGNLPRTIVNGISFTYNNVGYAGLGHDGNTANGSLYQYDDASDTWTPLASFPGPNIIGASHFVIDDKVYVVGGFDSGSSNQVWAYNITTDTWSQKQGYPTNLVDGMGFSINGTGYICGGDATTGPGIWNKVYAYNPTTNKWTQKAAIPGAVRQMGAAFALNNMGYCGLGTSDPFLSSCQQDFFMYDPITNTWSPIDDFPPGKVSAPLACTLGSKAYVGGGTLGLDVINYVDFYEYEAPENTTSLSDEKGEGKMILYPVPSSGQISLKNNTAGFKTYKIHDLQGKILAEGEISQDLDIRVNLREGIYNLILFSDSETLNQRIIISNK